MSINERIGQMTQAEHSANLPGFRIGALLSGDDFARS